MVRALRCHGEMCPTQRDMRLERSTDASGAMLAVRRRQKHPKLAPTRLCQSVTRHRQLEPRHDLDVPDNKKGFRN